MKMYSWKDIENLLDTLPHMRKKESIKSLGISLRFLSEKLKVFYGRQENELGEGRDQEREDSGSGLS